MSFLPIVIIFLGAFLLFRLRFFIILNPIATFKELKRSLSSPLSRKNLALSLAGTLGVGNIVGVAVGISVGGAGCVFWLLVSSLFSSIIKYSESAISADLSSEWGIVGIFRVLFKRCGKYLGIIYAFSCILLSFLLGSSIQSTAVAGCAFEYGVPKLASLSLVTLFIIIVILIGRDKIKGITTILVPLASCVYIFLCLYSIIANCDKLPSVVSEICSNAFSCDATVGGVLGFLTGNAVKEGFSRGLMSNEAGAGTSSLANSEGISDPTHAGLLGVVEVFFDTVVVCTLSALAILVSSDGRLAQESGMKIVISGLGKLLGGAGGYLLLVCVSLFALSSMICWYYYGMKCVNYLNKGYTRVYTLLFVASIYLPLLFSEAELVFASDFLLFILTIMTSFSLIKSSDRLKRLSELGGLIKCSHR